jgi:hypothetical protein
MRGLDGSPLLTVHQINDKGNHSTRKTITELVHNDTTPLHVAQLSGHKKSGFICCGIEESAKENVSHYK